MRLYVLNLEDSERQLKIAPAALRPRSARLIGLDGSQRAVRELTGDALHLPVPPRAWLGVELDV